MNVLDSLKKVYGKGILFLFPQRGKKVRKVIIDKIDKSLELQAQELETLGGLMSQEEIIKRISHLIKLLRAERKWLDESIYNDEQLRDVKQCIELEKKAEELYNKATREDEKDGKEVARAEGRLEMVSWFKGALHGE